MIKPFSDNFEQIQLHFDSKPGRYHYPVMTVSKGILCFNKAFNSVTPWKAGDRVTPFKYGNKLCFKKDSNGPISVTGKNQLSLCNKELVKIIRSISNAQYWRIVVDGNDVYAEEEKENC